MICSWSNELTEMPNQVVIVRVDHVTRIWIDGHNAQAVRAASIVRAMIGFKRNVPEFHRFGPVLHRLHQEINSADGSNTRSRCTFCFEHILCWIECMHSSHDCRATCIAVPGNSSNITITGRIAQQRFRVIRIIPIMVIRDEPGVQVGLVQCGTQIVLNEI